LTITGHFFDDYNEYHSVVLSFKKFYLRHFSSNLARFISAEMNKLVIADKIVGITTDNGADIKAATTDLWPQSSRMSCIAHSINLVVQKSFNLWNHGKKLLLTKEKKTKKNHSEEEQTFQEIEDVVYQEHLEEMNDLDGEDFDQVIDSESEVESDDDDDDDDDEDITITPFSNFQTLSKELRLNYLTLMHSLIKRVRKLVKIFKNNSIVHAFINDRIKQLNKSATKEDKIYGCF